MARKNVTVSLRKPPPVESLTLVSNDRDAPAELDLAPAAQPTSWVAPRMPQFWGEQVSGPRGESFQECTLHLEPELARKLAMRCIEEDRNPSKFVADAVGAALGRERPPVSLPIRVARAVVRMLREGSPLVAAVLDA
jgi:hypothetical protein